jgi:hypothetical protein
VRAVGAFEQASAPCDGAGGRREERATPRARIPVGADGVPALIAAVAERRPARRTDEPVLVDRPPAAWTGGSVDLDSKRGIPESFESSLSHRRARPNDEVDEDDERKQER